MSFVNTKIGRPRKATSFFGLNSDNEDGYIKTVVIHVRVSHEEKHFFKKLASLKGDNISCFIRRLIFDVYKRDIREKPAEFIDKLLSDEQYCFNTNRTELIHIRFTEKEKEALNVFARYHHRDVSSFIRWIVLQVYISDFIKIA